MVVGPVDMATGSFLSLIDGTRTMQQLVEQAALLDLPPEHVRGVVDRLGAAGLLESPTAGGPAAEAVRTDQAAFEQLRPDLASLSVRHPEPAGALGRMGARRAVRARVKGAGRVGAAVAALLSASGIGRVEVFDGGTVQPWDALPGGLPAERIGERRRTAAERLVQQTSPWSRAPRPRVPVSESGEPGLSLVVLTPRDGLGAYAPDPVLSEPLLTAGIPHLYAGVIEGTGVVGPLVLPGGSACARCDELRRTDAEAGLAAVARAVAVGACRTRGSGLRCRVGNNGRGDRRRPGGGVPRWRTPAVHRCADGVPGAVCERADGADRTASGVRLWRCRVIGGGRRLGSTVGTRHNDGVTPVGGQCELEGRMSDLPRKAVTRTAKLAALPLGFASTAPPGAWASGSAADPPRSSAGSFNSAPRSSFSRCSVS